MAVHVPGSVLTAWFIQPLITGASLSLTVTLNMQRLARPPASVAVQTTITVPLSNVEPLGGSQTTEAAVQLSMAAGPGQLTIALHTPGAVPRTMSAGQVMDGGSVSLTVTVNVQLLELPHASVAVQVTV